MSEHMTIHDKREFLRENVKDVVLFDRTEDSYINAMYQLYHIAKDPRFPQFIRNAISVVFAQIEDGNYAAELNKSELEKVAVQARAIANKHNIDALAGD